MGDTRTECYFYCLISIVPAGYYFHIGPFCPRPSYHCACEKFIFTKQTHHKIEKSPIIPHEN